MLWQKGLECMCCTRGTDNERLFRSGIGMNFIPESCSPFHAVCLEMPDKTSWCSQCFDEDWNRYRETKWSFYECGYECKFSSKIIPVLNSMRVTRDSQRGMNGMSGSKEGPSFLDISLSLSLSLSVSLLSFSKTRTTWGAKEKVKEDKLFLLWHEDQMKYLVLSPKESNFLT